MIETIGHAERITETWCPGVLLLDSRCDTRTFQPHARIVYDPEYGFGGRPWRYSLHTSSDCPHNSLGRYPTARQAYKIATWELRLAVRQSFGWLWQQQTRRRKETS